MEDCCEARASPAALRQRPLPCRAAAITSAATRDLLPKTIKTIAVPAFGNVTPSYQLARC